jgi:hypothetical protein
MSIDTSIVVIHTRFGVYAFQGYLGHKKHINSHFSRPLITKNLSSGPLALREGLFIQLVRSQFAGLQAQLGEA